MTPLRSFLALAALFVAPAWAQAPAFFALDESATAELARLNIPGASIAIVRGSEVVYAKAFGVANVETGEPARTEMLFRLDLSLR
jgi:CubicO group peptidase (beta-lactamase class C family)